MLTFILYLQCFPIETKMKFNKMLPLIAALVLASCTPAPKGSRASQERAEQKQTKEIKTMTVEKLTAETFKEKVMNYDLHPDKWVFEGKRPAIIDFYATWCGPCKATAPHVERFAETYAGKVDVYKVDVDEQEELAALFGIQSIPSILFIPVGGEPKMQVGGMNYGQLDSLAHQALGI